MFKNSVLNKFLLEIDNKFKLKIRFIFVSSPNNSKIINYNKDFFYFKCTDSFQSKRQSVEVNQILITKSLEYISCINGQHSHYFAFLNFFREHGKTVDHGIIAQIKLKFNA